MNKTGSSNTAVGYQALHNDISGNNTAVGYQALLSNTTGYNNTAYGFNSLPSNTTGYQNTCMGMNSDVSNNYFNSTAIGYNAQAQASNTIVLGDNNITNLKCSGAFTFTSDARDKKNIEDIPLGLDFINKLHPVKFDWNMRDNGKVDIEEFGFIAQELQSAQLEMGKTVPNLVYDKNPDRLEASYGTLVPILVKAIQELSTKNTELSEKISILENKQ